MPILWGEPMILTNSFEIIKQTGGNGSVGAWHKPGWYDTGLRNDYTTAQAYLYTGRVNLVYTGVETSLRRMMLSGGPIEGSCNPLLTQRRKLTAFYYTEGSSSLILIAIIKI